MEGTLPYIHGTGEELRMFSGDRDYSFLYIFPIAELHSSLIEMML